MPRRARYGYQSLGGNGGGIWRGIGLGGGQSGCLKDAVNEKRRLLGQGLWQRLLDKQVHGYQGSSLACGCGGTLRFVGASGAPGTHALGGSQSGGGPSRWERWLCNNRSRLGKAMFATMSRRQGPLWGGYGGDRRLGKAAFGLVLGGMHPALAARFGTTVAPLSGRPAGDVGQAPPLYRRE
jgi:hypothetical protein